MAPVFGAQFAEDRHVERTCGLGKKLAHLQRRRRLLAQVVHAVAAIEETKDEFALAHPAATKHRDECRPFGTVGLIQQAKFCVSPNEIRHAL